MKHTIYPCIWFNNNAAEAADFYSSVFNNTSLVSQSPFVSLLEVNGQKIMYLNGGPQFTPNPAISFYVVCETQAELTKTWKLLMEGGSVWMPLDQYEWSEQYGWLSDRYGVSWQIALGKISEVGQKISPSLLFTGTQLGKAETAIQFYTSVFSNSSIHGIQQYKEGEPDKGLVKHAQFNLGKFIMMAMDSSMNHDFSFNEAVSFVVNCDTQAEIDYYWNSLTKGGEESMCGWLKDQFGVSWQIVPAKLEQWMRDPERGQRVVNAFLKMRKFDIETLLKA